MEALNIDPRVYRKQVEDILRKYPLYKQALKFHLHASTTMDYSIERVDGGDQEYSSPTEKYGTIRAEYSKLVQQVDSTLELLTEKEKELIEKSYFKRHPIVWEACNLSRAGYYLKRNEVLDKVAIALNLI